MRSKTKIIIAWFKTKEAWVFLSILFVAAILRLYKIGEYLTFLGDQGRDVLVIKRMVVDGELTLLGPITSVGSIFLGPLYYYFITPFLVLFNFNPVGPALFIVLLSLVSFYILYRICVEYFSFATFVFAAILYATSPLVLTYSRFSWNPNAVPFFTLLLIYSCLKVVIDKKDTWLFGAGISLGVLFQLHYLTLVLVPVFLGLLYLRKFRIHPKYYGLFFIGLFIPLVPFILFELRHQFTNTQTALRFITKSDNTGQTNISIRGYGKHFEDIFVRLFWRLVVVKNAELTKLFILSLFAGLIVWFRKLQKSKNIRQLLSAKVLWIWFWVGILVFSLYQGSVYDYYFVPFFPLPFLLTGIFLAFIFQKRMFGKIISVALLCFFVVFHLQNSPFQFKGNNQVAQTKQIAEFVLDKVGNAPYNFALIAEHNSDHAYRYFLEVLDDAPIEIKNPDIDPDRSTVTNQLFVVCEDKICQPLGHPLWEIAGFGRANIAKEWDLDVVKVFKLVPLEE